VNAPVNETARGDTQWNFTNSRGSNGSLDRFLQQKEADGVNQKGAIPRFWLPPSLSFLTEQALSSNSSIPGIRQLPQA
jgi:hypothetical protein